MMLQQFTNASGSVYATVGYDERNNCVYDSWEGMFGTQDNFKRVLSYVSEVIEEKKATRWLADLRKMNGSFDGSKEWIIRDLIPKVTSAGLLYQAIVLPQNVFSKLSAKDTITRISKFEIRQFDDIDKAKSWLKQAAPSLVN